MEADLSGSEKEGWTPKEARSRSKRSALFGTSRDLFMLRVNSVNY